MWRGIVWGGVVFFVVLWYGKRWCSIMWCGVRLTLSLQTFCLCYILIIVIDVRTVYATPNMFMDSQTCIGPSKDKNKLIIGRYTDVNET